MNLNQIVISGHIGADPELRYTQNKLPILNFSIAQNEGKKDLEQKSMWFDISVFDPLATSLHMTLKKGDEVIVIGKIRIHTYQDKSGMERKKVQITAYNIRLLTHKRIDPLRNIPTQTSEMPSKNMTQAVEEYQNLDIPF